MQSDYNMTTIKKNTEEKFNTLFSELNFDIKYIIWNFLFTRNYECVKTLKGHSDTVRSLAILGENIISGSNDDTIKIWRPMHRR